MKGSQNISTTKGALDVIQRMLVKRNETLGVAESVTSGNLQASLSLAKNATEFSREACPFTTPGKSRVIFKSTRSPRSEPTVFPTQ